MFGFSQEKESAARIASWTVRKVQTQREILYRLEIQMSSDVCFFAVFQCRFCVFFSFLMFGFTFFGYSGDGVGEQVEKQIFSGSVRKCVGLEENQTASKENPQAGPKRGGHEWGLRKHGLNRRFANAPFQNL